MPRQVRIEFPGATYHVMCRGDRREEIFRDDGDREMMLATLAEAVEKTGWQLHAWVWMGNHYHLLVETPEANLVKGMTWFQTTYTTRFNARHRLRGHLFGGRYKAVLVDREEPRYFFTLLRNGVCNGTQLRGGTGPGGFPRKGRGWCVVAFAASALTMTTVMRRSTLSLLFCFAVAWPGAAVAQFLDDPPAKKPAASQEPLDPKKAIQKIEGNRFKCGVIEFDQKSREIRIPCKINMREGPLEYVLVHESGKVHESLLSTAARPMELNIVLLLLNWQKSGAFFDFSEPERGGLMDEFRGLRADDATPTTPCYTAPNR